MSTEMKEAPNVAGCFDHEEIRRARQCEEAMQESLRTMEKRYKRLESHSTGEEKYIRYLENFIEQLETSLTQTKDIATTAKRDTNIQRLRADKCEAFLQDANGQVQQDEKKILRLEYTTAIMRENRAKDQRRAEFAEKEYDRLSSYLAAKTPDTGRSQTSPANADLADVISQLLLLLYGETQELRNTVHEQTLKLGQLEAPTDLVSELRHVRISTERENAKLYDMYSSLSETVSNVQTRVQEPDQTKKRHNQAKKRKVAKHSLDRQVCSSRYLCDVDKPWTDLQSYAVSHFE